MKIFTNRDFKRFFGMTVVILVLIILLGQILAYLLTMDYKKEMMTHDRAVLGCAVQNHLDAKDFYRAYAMQKSDDDLKSGEILLKKVAYDESTNNEFLPEIQKIHSKYAIIMFVFSLIFSAVILFLIFFFYVRQDKKFEKANDDITRFLEGHYDTRLDDGDEGSISILFSSINEMATSLVAHISKETQNKEFLKETISDISHQLKTPLTALQMYQEIMQDEKIDNEVVVKFLKKSSRELDHMEILILNLLKLARLDAGAIDLVKADYQVKEFLLGIIDRFLARAEREEKSITLTCDEKIYISCDEIWLAEAISNIIKNGLDHMKSGGKMELSCEETSVVTKILIRDSGEGIHPEDIHSIFKRFYRSKFSSSSQGIGIGLTLAKSIVEKHGGIITVESEWGKGTTFILTFSKLTDL